MGQNLKLQEITLSDFKGVNSFTAKFSGKNAFITGENGAGKTSIYNAFLWLISGKDASGRDNYQVKPLGVDGKPKRSGLEPTVEATFLYENGTTFTIKRVLQEKWSTERGKSEREYKGDETKCYVNDVPTAISKFNRWVEDNIGTMEQVLMLTNLWYFSTHIDNNARRKLLFSAFGEKSDAEVIESVEELNELGERLEGRTVDEYRLVLAEQRKKINNDLDSLPVRIDEASKQLVDVANIQDIHTKREVLKNEISLLDEKIAVGSVNGSQDIRIKIDEVSAKLASEERKEQQRQDDEKNAWQKNININKKMVNFRQDSAKNKVEEIEKSIFNLEKKVEKYSDDAKILRDQWLAEDSKTFLAEDNCPTCGQHFPKEHIEELKGNWNESHSKLLSDIAEDGKIAANEAKEYELLLQNKKIELNEAKKELETILAKNDEIVFSDFVPNIDAQDKALSVINGLKSDLALLENELEQAKEQQDFSALQSLNTEREQKQSEIEELQKIILQSSYNGEIENRIAGYEKQQKELLIKREQCEKMIYLCEEFTRKKVQLVTEEINKHFKIVTFMLFEEQKNGGLKNTCEILFDGVPFGSLNRARQFAGAVDTINGFSEAWGLWLPLFVDDAEGVHEDYNIKPQAQTIRLNATKDGDLAVAL